MHEIGEPFTKKIVDGRLTRFVVAREIRRAATDAGPGAVKNGSFSFPRSDLPVKSNGLFSLLKVDTDG